MAGTQQVVVFELSGERYALDITYVNEIIRVQPATPVPGAPDYFQGVINRRNRVFPVADLRRRFGLPTNSDSDQSRIIVLQVGNEMLGIMVDAVSEVMEVTADVLEPAANVVSGLDAEYIGSIAKVENELVAVLHPGKIFNDGEDQQA